MLALGEEEHAHTVLALVAKADVQFFGHLGEELVADLQQNAHTVAGLALGILAGTVLQPFHNGQCIVHGLVAFAALDIHHSANAAGIVLKLWIVQTKGVFLLCKVFHRLSHPYLKSSPVRHPPHFDKKKSAPQGHTLPLQNAFVPVTIIILNAEKSSSDSCTKYDNCFTPLLVRNAAYGGQL